MGIFNDTSDNKKDKKKPVKKTVKETKVEPVAEDSMKDLYNSEGKAKAKSGKKISGQAYRVLIKPMITEKATNLSAVNQYIFMVANDANKIEVAKAINEVYGVKPVSVNIVSVKGKKVSRGRITGKRKDFKKAIITLKKGETISIYEGV
jgi:large subunit ribosomal protein L23